MRFRDEELQRELEGLLASILGRFMGKKVKGARLEI
jgi:hypothetical protein